MSSGVKIRSVVGWMGVMFCFALVAVAVLSKQNWHSRLSREVAETARSRDALATEVLLLETEARGLRLYPRLEAVARERLGLVNPTETPIVIAPAGQVVAERNQAPGAAEAPVEIKSARWKGFFR
jgi:cell division protein FtsB